MYISLICCCLLVGRFLFGRNLHTLEVLRQHGAAWILEAKWTYFAMEYSHLMPLGGCIKLRIPKTIAFNTAKLPENMRKVHFLGLATSRSLN